MKKLVVFSLLLAVPLVAAAVLASVTYAFDRFTADSQPVHADGAGVDSKDGYAITTVHDGDQEYLVVSTYAPYAGDKEEDKGTPRQFVSVYEVNRKGEGKAELVLVCSRCIQWDRGFELLNLKSDDQRPSQLKRLLEK
ncbi:MAG: hypothetical protein KDB82_06425 [Planctomycetes bacterium]|nr:hypothetical protein [Planctomycetota bacterium]